MYNRKHTLDLAALFNALAIDLKVELEILDFETPTVSDHHAALVTAWRLSEAGVKASNVAIEAKQLFITQRFNLKGTPGISIELTMQFDHAFGMSLVQTDVLLRGVTAANSKGWDFPHYFNEEKRCHEFTDVDMAMFTTIPALMASFVQGIWRFVFNDDYSADWVHMAVLSLDMLTEKKNVRVNQRLHAILQPHHINLLDAQTDTTDLVGLAARLFLQNRPQEVEVCFVVGPTAEREPQYVLCVEADEA